MSTDEEVAKVHNTYLIAFLVEFIADSENDFNASGENLFVEVDTCLEGFTISKFSVVFIEISVSDVIEAIDEIKSKGKPSSK